MSNRVPWSTPSARGKAYCLPGGTPNLGKDVLQKIKEAVGKSSSLRKRCFVGKEYWLGSQLEKDARVSGGTTGARHGGRWVRGLFLAGSHPPQCGSVATEPSLVSMFTGT